MTSEARSYNSFIILVIVLPHSGALRVNALAYPIFIIIIMTILYSHTVLYSVYIHVCRLRGFLHASYLRF